VTFPAHHRRPENTLAASLLEADMRRKNFAKRHSCLSRLALWDLGWSGAGDCDAYTDRDPEDAIECVRLADQAKQRGHKAVFAAGPRRRGSSLAEELEQLQHATSSQPSPRPCRADSAAAFRDIL